ncbi:MAG: beta strand repeat-containing protein [Phycisphaerales bacterium]
MSIFGRSRRNSSAGTSRRGWGGRLVDRLWTRAGTAVSRSQNEFECEALEQRQLLFALTVTNVDPATGLGTATAQFGYVAPFLFKPIPAAVMADVVTEEFEDEMAPWTMAPQQPPAVPNNTIFAESDIRMSFSSVSAAPVTWVLGPDGMMTMDRDLSIRLSANDFVLFEFLDVPDAGGGPITARVANQVIINTTGLDLNPVTGTRIDLLLGGEVVESFSPAALAALNNGGQLTLVDLAGPNGLPAFGFDSFRVSSFQTPPDNNNYFDQFVIDDITATFPGGRFGMFNEERVFGAQVTIVGPLGATAEFFDLYDRQIRQTLALGVPPGSQQMVALVDQNDDGVPDFNDGIGRIRLSGFGGASGTETRGMFTMVGGTITVVNNAFQFNLIDNIGGLADDFEQAGFGYTLTNMNPPMAIGLPAIAGSVLVGSPFVRDNSTPGAYLGGAGAFNFNRANQGVFSDDANVSMSSVVIHGTLHGSSRFSGALGRYGVAMMPGSLTVRGDLGALYVAGDSGVWTADSDPNNALRTTSSTIQVGRTLGEANVGGRMVSNLIVQADINNPSLAILPTFDYFEREVVYGIDPAAGQAAVVNTFLNAMSRQTQAVPFGGNLFRNDSITGAEFIGVNSAGVRLRGSLGQFNAIDSAEDAVDVYAFAADGNTDVVISMSFDDMGQNRGQAYFRVLDASGFIVAGSRFVSRQPGDDRSSAAQLSGPNSGDRIVFRPDHADVYYLVVSTPTDGQFPSDLAYEAVVTGLAPVTVGSIRTGSGLGHNMAGGANVISVSAGNVGSLRVGVGYVTGAAGESDGLDVTNSMEDPDDAANFRFSSVSVAGNLYNVTTGSDINGAQLLIGGNLGGLFTGASALVGGGPNEGDINTFTLSVGGTIGIMLVAGGVGWENDSMPPAPRGTVNIRTGTNGGPGHIGLFQVGDRLVSGTFSLTTSDRSIIDAFVVQAGNGVGIVGERLPQINMGVGSDIRFMTLDAGNIENGSNPNAFTPLVPGQTVTIVDDGGATLTIRIAGGTPGAMSFGQIRFLPIDSSQGVAIARIDAVLNGGASLEIGGLTAGVASIGLININTDGAGSVVNIASTLTEIDIGLIQSDNALAAIRNTSIRGDILAADVGGLTSLTISSGNLGSTQLSGVVGLDFIAPFVPPQSGYSNQPGAPVGVNPGSINGNWNGQVFVPVGQRTAMVNQDETLEDLGAPFDYFLTGLIVRTGNLATVTVAGSIGDVILQGGNIGTLRANSDGITMLGGFDGIVGSIYANDIGTIDIGDGLAEWGPSPFAKAGIFADDDITSVFGGRGLNPVIRGVIIAADTNVDAGGNVNGLLSVNLDRGRYDGAYLGGTVFDEFWNSARFTRNDGQGDDLAETDRKNVVAITATLSEFFRSRVVGANINSVNIINAAFDASTIDATGNVGSIIAQSYRNSTLLGEPLEFRPNAIFISGNLASLITAGLLGDISDLNLNVRGALTGQFAGQNIIRSNVGIANNTASIQALNDIRASTFTTGRLTFLSAGADIRSSEITAAGPIITLTAGSNITSTAITSTGPGGGITTLQARFYITGSISAAGPITSIRSTEGDIIASIMTTESNGTLGTLSAGRDLIVSLDVSGDVTTIMAGRNIGQQGEQRGLRLLNIRGNLANIMTPNGQIYTDLRIGQSITGAVRVGRVVALPGNDLVSSANITAYGRINLVDIQGDLNGNITSESGGIGTVMITNGSFRAGKTIRANDGSIGSVTIRGGHLLGNVIAEEAIDVIQLFVGTDGFAGDIGVNPFLSPFAFFDPLRNQLPPDTQLLPTFQGPRIQAGTNIGRVEVERASMWETAIYAGNAVLRVYVWGTILNDTITPGIGGNFIAAGDSVNSVEALHFAGGLIVAAGITNLGADNRPGGTGANADIVQFGRVGDLFFRGGTGAVTVAAGMNAGADGIYNTADDAVANGISSIGSVNVTGGAVQTTAFADNGIGFTSPGVVRGGPGLHQAEPNKVIEFVPGSGQVPAGGLAFTTTVGETGRITLTGPGQAYFQQVFDSALGRNVNRLALINTTLATRLIVDTNQNSLTDFRVLSNDGASLGYASIRGNMFGDSSFYFDGYVQFVEFGGLNVTGSIGAGNDIGQLIIGNVTRGYIDANHIQSILVGGDFGLRDQSGEAAIRVLSAGDIRFFGSHFGLISSSRDISSVMVGGAIERAAIRSGRSIGTITAGAGLLTSRISALNNITLVNITGNMIDSLIYAGTDLGSDGTFGGVGSAADVVSNGSIQTVLISGFFRGSDIAAGVARGNDGFLGTPDDVIDEGHSSIGTVTINGTASGSLLNSQSYRIISNGTIGTVRAAGQTFTGNGNLLVRRFSATADALRVVDVRITESSRLYSERIQFNQAVNQSTLAQALSVFEVRNGGTVTIRLAQNVDYSISYDPTTFTVIVTFSRDITERSLPQQNGVPGPGVYRFVLDAAVLRGETQGARLDGNANGILEGDADSFSADDIVGDAGDKRDNTPNDANNVGNAVIVGNATIGFRTIDLRYATDLNLVLDNNYAPDGLPDPNRSFRLRGIIGDHQDQDINFFGPTNDVDLYRVTLRAGQVLRLGDMLGVAQVADRQLLDANGNIIAGINATAQPAPTNPLDPTQTLSLTGEQQFLITTTGTYFIAVAARVLPGIINNETAVPNFPIIAGTVGDYNFSINIFDDGDTGFRGDSDSSNGVPVATAPVPAAFRGNDNVFNTGDDLASVVNGLYVFTLGAGADGVRGTGDDIVSGSNGSGITSQRTSGPDGVFGTSDDRIVSFVDASIGESNYTGVPQVVAPDVDVYHLNNGEVITPGTRVRATIRLSELGSNIGLFSNPLARDLRGTAQFAIFDTTNSVGVADAQLLAAPSDFRPIGGTPGDVVTNGNQSYGYDSSGDFFIEFVVPVHAGVPGGAGTYALYVQGAVQSDYSLEIVTQGTGTLVSSPRVQNILLETTGGTVDWLGEHLGSTVLQPFRSSAVGFSGVIGSQPVDSYIISNLVANLQALFTASGVDVRISSDPASFEGQDFSTVFLTSSNEPTFLFANETFGVSEHADAFNLDQNDEAIVFLPSLGLLGLTPARADVDRFVTSLTGASARRIGELIGLRTVIGTDGSLNPSPANPYNSAVTDPMNANSVRAIPAGVPFRFSNVSRALSPSGVGTGLGGGVLGGNGGDVLYDTDFFLGQSTTADLLRRIMNGQ